MTQFDTIFAILQTTGARYVVVGGVAKLEPPAGSFEAAELNLLRMALKSTYGQRLQDLQDMLDFNAEAEARNPRLGRIAAQLRRQSADRIGESPAPCDDA